MQKEYTSKEHDEAIEKLRDVPERRIESATQSWRQGLRGIAFYSVCERPRFGVGCGSCDSCHALRIVLVTKTGRA